MVKILFNYRLNGFEWKGVFIRVQVEVDSKYLFREIKSLNYLFFEYIQIIDTYKIKGDSSNFLSNDLIFPLISYLKNNALVLLGSACINKYNYDVSILDNIQISSTKKNKDITINHNNYSTVINNEILNTFGMNNNNGININAKKSDNPYYSHYIKPSENFESQIIPNSIKLDVNNNHQIKNEIKELTNIPNNNVISKNYVNDPQNIVFPKFKNINDLFSSEGHKHFRNISAFTVNNPINKDSNNKDINNSIRKKSTNRSKIYNDNISRIQPNDSFHSICVSQNANQDINTDKYIREDIDRSLIFRKLKDFNLIKVIDDINENYNTEATNHKFKFLIISAEDLIPNLLDSDIFYNYILFDDEEKSDLYFFNERNFDKVFKEKSNEKIFTNIRSLIEMNPSSKGEIKITNEILQRIVSPTVSLTNRVKDIKDFKMSKGNMRNKMSEEDQKKFFIDYENTISNLKFKVYFCNEENIKESKKNIRMNEYFLYNHSKQIILSEETRKILGSIQSDQYYNKFYKRFYENPNKYFSGRNIIAYGLESSIKLKYSLIKGNINKSKFCTDFHANLICNLAKVLDSNYNINNTFTLDNFFHRYGVNKSFDFFVLTKMKNSIIADLIKISLLSKLIKKVLYFNEGINIESKIFIMNLMIFTKNCDRVNNLLLDSGFPEINEKSLQNIHFQKIFLIIQSILKAETNDFTKYFYDNLIYFTFIKVMKLKLLNDYYDFKVDFSSQYSTESIILDFIKTANKKPFLFLSILENQLNISIDKLIKFKASISRENFLHEFKSSHIIDNEMIPKSYINLSEVSYYLLAKCIFTSKTSKKLDSLKDLKEKCSFSNSINNGKINKQSNNLAGPHKILNSRNSKETKPTTTIETSNYNGLNKEIDMNLCNPNELLTKLNLGNPDKSKLNYFKVGNNNEKIYKLTNIATQTIDKTLPMHNNNINLKVNANNITKINNMNMKYTDYKGNGYINSTKSKSSDKRKIFPEKTSFIKVSEIDEESFLTSRSKLSLIEDLELPIPAILYKLNYVDEEISDNKLIGGNIYKFLSNKYNFSKIDIIKDWKSQLEIVLNDSVSFDCSESIILNLYILLFLHSFFIESDMNNSKEILYRIKEWLKIHNFYQPEQLATINLLEGMFIERKNYVESEEFYTKSIIFSLIIYGDPRGRGSNGIIFLLYPLWKICRQSCILENSMIHENLKELFYAQDNHIKNLLESNYSNHTIIETNMNNLIDQDVIYNEDEKLSSSRQVKNMKINLKNSLKQGLKTSFDLSEININLEENIEENILIEKDAMKISLSNYEFFKLKYFPFPSISDIKTSYGSYFSSEKFISFFMKNLPIFFPSNQIWSDETLKSLNLNPYTAINSNESFANYSRLYTNSSQKSKATKPKGEIFSSYLYDSLLEKLSFKNTPPKGIVLAWGNNSHNETSHNNYEKMYLPRLCFKIKEDEIVSVKSGWEFNLALTKNKSVFSWGNNEAGQCGLNSTLPIIFSPTKIDIKNIKMITCGNEHSMALNDDNEIYSWGHGKGGVLGFNEEGNVLKPRKIEDFLAESICSGSLHNLALGKDGSLYSWGCGEGGQLGHSEEFLVIIIY